MSKQEQLGAPLTEDEIAALTRGGLDLSPVRPGEFDSFLERSKQEYQALLDQSESITSAAKRLHVSRSRVRQSLAKGRLYGIRSQGRWHLPQFQFEGEGLVPGISEVLTFLDRDLHPLSVEGFFNHPTADFGDDNDINPERSPREWLIQDRNPQVVAGLVKELGIGL